ncbi:MAG TPA: undecaprenyl-phosphate glucose phosphotransferase, partial [Thermoanaerobaculia bacterium]|nr:undecaprenyl-phosphate glucose phosphotransferase [Thermoanaerobaculia bacterium]
MIRQRHRENIVLFLAGDLLATLAAFFAAWYLRFDLAIVPLTKDVPEFAPYLLLLPFIVVVWPVVYYFHGLYQIRRGQSRVEELFTLVSAQALATIILAGITTFYRPPREPGSLEYFTYSRAFLALFVAVAVVLVAGTRFSLRAALRELRQRGHSLRRILVIGAGRAGTDIAQKLLSHRELGFRVAGFLDDDPSLQGRRLFDVPVLGRLPDVAEVLERERIDQVVIALPLEAHKKILRILDQVSSECVEVRLVPDILQYATLRATLEDLDGTPMINLSQVPLQGWQSLAKRGMDLLISSAAMLVLMPFLPFVALAIWLEDRGPIFYRQERMGLDGRPFQMIKLRSMRVDAEASTGPIWAVEQDPRRTRLGSFLRRTSLDELPQLWNIFKGEMSIVGPRPERPAFVSEFKHKIPNYMLRHRVKSGMTGWAQVHGWRGNTSIKKRIQYDLYYIENWSLGLDLKILWMTLKTGWLH